MLAGNVEVGALYGGLHSFSCPARNQKQPSCYLVIGSKEAAVGREEIGGARGRKGPDGGCCVAPEYSGNVRGGMGVLGVDEDGLENGTYGC